MPQSSFFADGTTFIEPIKCGKCGNKAYGTRRTPHPSISHAELQTFECPHCGHRVEQSDLEAA
jgi:DNA-directed RNA polymerase subunit RPC12/RpoP